MSPRSRVKLGLDIARAESAMDVEDLRAQGEARGELEADTEKEGEH
jgi:hypothetical protein